MVNTIDAKLLAKMFLAGAKNLEAKKEWINELNVFPVPDGDTGTNMTLTIMSAAKEVAVMEDPDMATLCKAISSGSLRGARGNSGVILSQLFRGFTKRIKGEETLTIPILSEAFDKAVETAYKAVMKPKEGTILTVAKGGADKARELAENGCDDLSVFIDEIIKYADEVLEKTPEMLPVLKQAGVVDSGGQGLMQVLKGAYDAFLGKELDLTIPENTQAKPQTETAQKEEREIRFGYCTEFIIMLERGEDVVESQLKEYLQKIGDCVVVVADDDIVKVHVHTNDPGLAIQKALTYGSLTSMKIDNMREEHQEKVIRDAQKVAESASAPKKEEPRKENGFIAVAAGDGLADIFRDLGVDYVIEGGQTMNPSTDDVLSAIEQVNAENIFVLPNNGNIILAANQAKNLTEDKEVYVVPSKNIPQGIAAMISFVSGRSAAENAESMEEEMQLIKSGQVTYAVRDTNMDGKDIKQGDFMGLTDKTIVSVGSDLQGTAKELIESLLDEDSELVSLYYGSDATKEQAEQLAEDIENTHEDVEVEVQYGGQPVYSYFISVE